MNLFKHNKLAFLTLFFLLIFTTPLTNASTNIKAKNGNHMTITITDAFYLDADNDTYQDDVQAFFEINLCDMKNVNTFDLYIELTLPSDTTFLYTYSITTKLKHLEFCVVFYDHATERGWYDINIHSVLKTGGTSYGVESYTFDPPGGNKGGDPQAALFILS